MQLASTENLSLTDERHGYEFGCDGLMSIAEARSFLGGISDDTIESLFNAGSIRKARVNGRRIGICRRSVLEYLKAQELIPQPGSRQ